MLKTCKLCGKNFVYVDDNKEDVQRHNEKHAPLLEALDPSPSPNLRKELENRPDAVWVTRNSDCWLRKEIRLRAELFQREFGYNHVQWEYDGVPEKNGVGFLFHDESFRIVGACAFRPIWEGSSSGGSNESMRLDWLWICPRSRRSGVLASQWERFRERFGVFAVESPLSKSMFTFLTCNYADHEVIFCRATMPLLKYAEYFEQDCAKGNDLTQFIPV